MESWKKEGEMDTLVRVREKIRYILETHEPEPLPDDVIEKLEYMKSEGEKELVQI